jgi:Family of unknown function (DUF5686)/CarboxypepD_reg-like domain
MLRPLLSLLFTLFSIISFAGKISGTVTDDKGMPLPYASISIKGTTKGTNANSSGHYSITLSPGQYTLICQYVSYKKEEKTITVTTEDQTVNFTLSVQQLTLTEVIVKKGEDPAYEIIRQAIKKRSYYNNQVDSFSVDVYIKGLLRSRGLPTRVFGKKVEREQNDGLDSLGKGILFLSESLTNVSFKKPDKIKYRVISSRVSGSNRGVGLSFPTFINFYQNNVSVFDNNINPRGFISPIADGALNYYKYHYEGSFVEDNKMVNTIRVTPKRKNEPLFSGTIQITEDDWRIFSLELLTTKDYSLELIDTLRVSQIHSSIAPDIWKIKNQVLYVATGILGFNITGNFVNVYSDYNLAPGFTKKYFDRILMKYDTAFNKKDTSYWNTVRPVALELDEKKDFVYKDSLARVTRDSFLTRRNIDSLRKNQKPITVVNIIWSGARHNFYGRKTTVSYNLKPLLAQLEYNTVEGVSVNVEQTFSLFRRKGKYNYVLDWNSRYGFSNSQFNSYANFLIKPRRENFRNRYLKLSGGKRVSQFNQENPINPLTNAAYTLFAKKNYMKLYENWFGGIEYNNRFESGLRMNLHAVYEDRSPVENTTDFSFFKKDRELLPNHPYELAAIPFVKHQALTAGITLSWQPGQRYIQFPDHKVPLGSDYPTFELEYNKGIKDILSSDVDFDKWKLTMFDNMNFKIGGELRYRLSIGGFLNNNKVEIPDLQHFNGNQTFYNTKYLNSFQLAPYYRYSNAESFYTEAHIEHHFNGLLSNKIPLFNKLKWYFVAGANTFYVNKNNNYVEVFVGVENIFKLFRVDFINAYQPGLNPQFGIRVGVGGIIGGKIKFDE